MVAKCSPAHCPAPGRTMCSAARSIEAACVLASDCVSAVVAMAHSPEGRKFVWYHSPYLKYGDGLKRFKYYVYR